MIQDVASVFCRLSVSSICSFKRDGVKSFLILWTGIFFQRNYSAEMCIASKNSHLVECFFERMCEVSMSACQAFVSETIKTRQHQLSNLLKSIQSKVIGQRRLIEHMFVRLLADGRILVVAIP